MTILDWVLSNLFEILTTIGIPITWVVTKKHFQKRDLKDRDVSTESNQAEVISQNLGLYQLMIDDIKKRYNEEIQEAYGKIDSLEAIIKELREANKMLDAKLYSFSNQLINIKGELEKHQKSNG
jgi:hypothetical protein